MTQFLPPNLLALFAPRDPIPFLPPAAKLPHEKKNKGYVGVGCFLDYFEDPNETPPPTRVETREERLERRRRERAEQVAYKLEQEIAVWDPHNIPTATVDPFKTLFVARINYDTSESKLRREFEVYGPIKKIVMTHNTVNGKPRGYAFIEYEHERDMHLWGAGDNLMCSLSIVCAIRYHCWLYSIFSPSEAALDLLIYGSAQYKRVIFSSSEAVIRPVNLWLCPV